MSIVVLTTAFEQNIDFSRAYFESLNNQTFKNFEVIVVDDGCIDLKTLILEFPNLRVRTFPGTGILGKNRNQLIKYAKELGYKKAIFADFDDVLSFNRIEGSVQKLNSVDIVVNDLSLVDSKGKIFEINRFSKNYTNNQEINLLNILESNIFGLSNTSVNLEKFNNIEVPDDVIVVDWFLFSIQLLEGKKAIFTNEFITFYRQHTNSFANIDSKSMTQLLNEAKIKNIHYSHMAKYSKNYVALRDSISEFAQCGDEKLYEHYLKIVLKDTDSSNDWWNLIKLKKLEVVKNETY